MAKTRTQYVCAACGYTTPRWVGRCPECGEWNTLQEETVNTVKLTPKRGGTAQTVAPLRTYAVRDLPADTETRLPTGIPEFDRVLGGGVVPGALTLIGGEPGIGKSTLMLQVVHALAAHGTVLYITGEESLRQVRMRALRLHATHPNFQVAAGAELPAILAVLESEQPLCAILDSIQTLYTPELEAIAGTISQIRTCAGALQRVAKEREIALFLIGHVTKEGALAGPKVLEHLVDTVLYFEGDPQGLFRILRATKNRFGATDEIGVFDMRPEGLVAVPNPSERLLAERAEGTPGSVVFPALEGSRALLMEIQALTTPSFLNTPRRVITGLAYERVSLVLAVMEKRLGFRMIQHDVFVNVAGGMRLSEPASDLAVLVAVASAMRNQPVRPDLVLFGEVGLGGEVRGVPHLEARLQESARLGFRCALVPQSNLQRRHERLPLSALPVRSALQAIQMALQAPSEAEETEEDDSPFR